MSVVSPLQYGSVESGKSATYRYASLDAWRGIAALLVVIHHVTPLKFGHAAVMMFFVISGYCISAAATSGLDKGMGFGVFMYRRFRRIYPPYLLSIAYVAYKGLAKVVLVGENDLVQWTVVEWIQNVTMTQWLTLTLDPQPLAFLNPTNILTVYWSLLYEEQFYLVVGVLMLIARWGSFRLSDLLLICTGLSLVWFIFLGDVSSGLFVDYWLMFGMGALVFTRLAHAKTPLAKHLIDAVLLVLFIGSAIVYAGDRIPLEFGEFERPRGMELFVTSGFALALIMMKPLDGWLQRSQLWPVLRFLGLISYSLYLTHYIILALVAKTVGTIPVELPLWLNATLQVMVHIGVATVFWYFCERPFLNKRYTPVRKA